nr:hypothetical protein [Tanacetum cinerariifolium]
VTATSFVPRSVMLGQLLVVEIEIDDITADDVDKVSCLTDIEKSK